MIVYFLAGMEQILVLKGKEKGGLLFSYWHGTDHGAERLEKVVFHFFTAHGTLVEKLQRFRSASLGKVNCSWELPLF